MPHIYECTKCHRIVDHNEEPISVSIRDCEIIGVVCPHCEGMMKVKTEDATIAYDRAMGVL